MSEVNPLRSVLDRLAAFEPVGLPVISLYLDARPDQTGRDKFDAFLRKELRARGRSFPSRSPERESFDQDSERVLTYVSERLEPSANGLALFACAGANGFFEDVQLDAPIAEHALYVADRPHLYPLARLADQFPLYAALIADSNSARMFVFGADATLRTESINDRKVSRSSVGGWSQLRYQRRVENSLEQHAKEVVAALERIVREEKIEQVVLAGDDVIVPVLRAQLPQHLAERVIDVLRLGIETPEHEVLKATTEALREHDARTDAQEVERMLGQYRAGQLGVVGVEGTLAALELGQVDTLLVSASPDLVPGDGDPAGGNGAPVEGSAEAPTVERLIRLARQTDAHITFIEDPSLLADVEGVGALLRFRL
jgi:peptide subunit release factor 1 (eRF1)